ncbi:MAG TPA: methylmalonyl Co-A mutase-associated GTPase MeaB, partial [Defluviicoccus sp.]|nr:methylmalonyl Co-A mutase-associated GTPase MeaB [Defluviicoccus sp.]
KADGDNEIRAKQAAIHYRNALHIVAPRSENWSPPVLMCSSLKGIGLDAVWEKLCEHKEKLSASGEFQAKRQKQRLKWMWQLVQDRLMTDLRSHPKVVECIPQIERDLLAGRLTATLAADEILNTFEGGSRELG